MLSLPLTISLSLLPTLPAMTLALLWVHNLLLVNRISLD